MCRYGGGEPGLTSVDPPHIANDPEQGREVQAVTVVAGPIDTERPTRRRTQSEGVPVSTVVGFKVDLSGTDVMSFRLRQQRL